MHARRGASWTHTHTPTHTHNRLLTRARMMRMVQVPRGRCVCLGLEEADRRRAEVHARLRSKSYRPTDAAFCTGVCVCGCARVCVRVRHSVRVEG
jgi:hypothetical protein